MSLPYARWTRTGRFRFGRCRLWPLAVAFLRAPAAVGSGIRVAGPAKRSRRRRRGGPTNDNSSTTMLLISSADETERNVAKKYGRRGQGPVGRRMEGEGKIPATFFSFPIYLFVRFIWSAGAVPELYDAVLSTALTNSSRTPTSSDDNYHYNHGCTKLKALNVKKKKSSKTARIECFWKNE